MSKSKENFVFDPSRPMTNRLSHKFAFAEFIGSFMLVSLSLGFDMSAQIVSASSSKDVSDPHASRGGTSLISQSLTPFSTYILVLSDCVCVCVCSSCNHMDYVSLFNHREDDKCRRFSKSLVIILWSLSSFSLSLHSSLMFNIY